MNSGFGAGLFVRGLVVVKDTFVVVGSVLRDAAVLVVLLVGVIVVVFVIVVVVFVVVVVVVVVVGVVEIVAAAQVGNESLHAPVSLHLSCEVPFNSKPSGHVNVTLSPGT